MKVLVCGGRAYRDRDRVFATLDAIHAATPITMVIEGGAPGADTIAASWAGRGQVACLSIPAEWRRFGNAAGPIRNARMLEVGAPDLVVAFPGTHGTANMVSLARKRRIEVREISA